MSGEKPMPDLAIFAGKVTDLNVERSGADGSAQLTFTLTPRDKDLQPQSFIVISNVAPQAFTGMVTMLTAAYATNLLVTVAYIEGELNKAIKVQLGGPQETKPGRMGFV
jgi:hypothetical protein